MKKPVTVSDVAQEGLQGATDWYTREAPQVLVGFLEDYNNAINAVEKYGSSLATQAMGVKRQLFSSFPFQLIVYDLPDRVLIVAVAHLKRKSDYWKRRLKRFI